MDLEPSWLVITALEADIHHVYTSHELSQWTFDILFMSLQYSFPAHGQSFQHCLPFKSHHKCHLCEAFSDAHLLCHRFWRTAVHDVACQRTVFSPFLVPCGFHPAVLPGACLLFVRRWRAPLEKGLSSILLTLYHLCHTRHLINIPMDKWIHLIPSDKLNTGIVDLDNTNIVVPSQNWIIIHHDWFSFLSLCPSSLLSILPSSLRSFLSSFLIFHMTFESWLLGRKCGWSSKACSAYWDYAVCLKMDPEMPASKMHIYAFQARVTEFGVLDI